MVSRIGWGIAGCGWVARDFAAPAIRESRNGRLVALFDVSAEAQARIAPDDALLRTTDLGSFLTAPGLGAIYVATPNHLHRALVEAAAAAGKAVLCEKPMATTPEDAEAMVAACERSGSPYATAFDQRFHPAHRQAAALVATGAIGRVTALRIVYACWLGPDWSDDNWRIDPRRAGGGAFFDLAPHGLDLAAMLLGEPLTAIEILGQHRVHAYAQGAIDDGAMLIARTASGVLAQLHVAYNCPEFLPRRRLELVGDRGQLTLTDTMGQDPGGRIMLHDAEGAREIPIEDSGGSPFTRQVEAFADHLLGSRRFGFEARDDLATMRALARLRDRLADTASRQGRS